MTKKSTFSPDDETTTTGRNAKLAALLNGPWIGLRIIQVERIEDQFDPSRCGWKATYREK